MQHFNYIILFVLVVAIVVYMLLLHKQNSSPNAPAYYSKTINSYSDTVLSSEEMLTNKLRGVFTTIGGGNDSSPTTLNEYYKQLRKEQEQLDPSIKNKIIIQLHYTDWCKYCMMIKPAWIKLRKSAPKNADLSGYIFLQVDHDKIKAPGIKTVPTVVKQLPDGNISIYSGNKSYSDLLAWSRSSLRELAAPSGSAYGLGRNNLTLN